MGSFQGAHSHATPSLITIMSYTTVIQTQGKPMKDWEVSCLCPCSAGLCTVAYVRTLPLFLEESFFFLFLLSLVPGTSNLLSQANHNYLWLYLSSPILLHSF